MSEWKICKLGDILNFRRGHDLPKSSMIKGYIPVAGSNGIIGCHNIATPISPCITIGRSGNVGTPHIYNKCWAHNTVLYVDDYKGNDPIYLYYLLKTLPLASFGGGSAVPTLNRNHIHPIEVKFCSSIKTQKKIAGILGALDDKIELNRRINANLEEQAQALFKSWFIENKPQNSRDGFFSDIIQTTLSGDWGQEMPKGNYSSEVYCIRGADIPNIKYGDRGKLPTRFILEKNLNNKRLSENDLVVEISGGSPTQSTGRICLITDSLLHRLGKDVICTNFCRALKPVSGYSFFIYLYWQYLYDNNIMFSYENGTTGIKNLDIADFLSKESIIIPNEKSIQEFNMVLQPVYNMIYKNGMENEQLSALRDTLLPKLMKGEINVG